MIYEGDVSHLGHLAVNANSRDGQHHISKYLNPEVIKENKFILRQGGFGLPALTMIDVKNYTVIDNQIHLKFKFGNYTYQLPAHHFYKPLIGGRIGYHPETAEAKVIKSLNREIMKETGGKPIFLYVGDECQSYKAAYYALRLEKVPTNGRGPKADLVLINSLNEKVCWISYKEHHFLSYGGVSDLYRRKHPAIMDFRHRVMEFFRLKNGVPKGKGIGRILYPKFTKDCQVIKHAMFGKDSLNKSEHGPDYVDWLMRGKFCLEKHRSHYHLTTPYMISPYEVDKFEELKIIAHTMPDRNDLGFKNTHVMVVSSNSHPGFLLV